jgi:hypothetical protein
VAREAAASDFVILALSGDRHLSFGFKRWIESWLTPAMDGSFSLVALFDSDRSTSHAGSARYCLREMSATAGVAFFAHSPSGNDVLPAATSPDRAEVIGRAAPRQRSVRKQRVHEIPVAA